jgi:uncharacterized membrane protein YcgQ (UPF0703/DUF1980 family)
MKKNIFFNENNKKQMEAPSATVLKLKPVEDIIAGASPTPAVSTQTSMINKVKSFCLSKLGVALLTSIVIFIILLILQPKYVLKKPTDNEPYQKINFFVVLVISLIAGLLVYFIPSTIKNSCVKK